MLRIEKKYDLADAADERVTLTFEMRSKSRLRAKLVSGEEVAIALDRGCQLYPGDLLVTNCGKVVEVCAANETLSVVESTDPLLLARACYHLGNRHVALQIETGGLRYLHDHVLDEMLSGLGITVRVVDLPFMPESGAYGNHAHLSGHRH